MPRGLGLLIYGMPGIGKTSFALQFPKPLTCLSIKETGYDDLELIGEVPEGCENVEIEDWEELLSFSKKCSDKTVVYDSTSGLQQILFEHVIAETYEGDAARFSSYSQGPRIDAPVAMSELESHLNYMRSKGTNVILLGHMKTEDMPNSMGPNYMSHVLDMDKGIRGLLTKWAQATLFMSVDIEQQQAVRSHKGQVISAKAKDVDDRLMHCQNAPGHIAKNRLGLPPYVSMGHSPKEAYENFKKKVHPNVAKDL